jgi:hypothetical protein
MQCRRIMPAIHPFDFFNIAERTPILLAPGPDIGDKVRALNGIDPIGSFHETWTWLSPMHTVLSLFLAMWNFSFY